MFDLTLDEWAQFGTVAQGAAALVLMIIAIAAGTAGLGDWRSKQRAQRDVAAQEAEEIRLNRQRQLNGWSPHGVRTYRVALVAQRDEAERALQELEANEPTDYVVLRVNESAYGNANRAYSLRQLIATEGLIGKVPTDAEYEALEAGRLVLNGGNESRPSWLERRWGRSLNRSSVD